VQSKSLWGADCDLDVNIADIDEPPALITFTRRSHRGFLPRRKPSGLSVHPAITSTAEMMKTVGALGIQSARMASCEPTWRAISTHVSTANPRRYGPRARSRSDSSLTIDPFLELFNTSIKASELDPNFFESVVHRSKSFVFRLQVRRQDHRWVLLLQHSPP